MSICCRHQLDSSKMPSLGIPLDLSARKFDGRLLICSLRLGGLLFHVKQRLLLFQVL